MVVLAQVAGRRTREQARSEAKQVWLELHFLTIDSGSLHHVKKYRGKSVNEILTAKAREEGLDSVRFGHIPGVRVQQEVSLPALGEDEFFVHFPCSGWPMKPRHKWFARKRRERREPNKYMHCTWRKEPSVMHFEPS